MNFKEIYSGSDKWKLLIPQCIGEASMVILLITMVVSWHWGFMASVAMILMLTPIAFIIGNLWGLLAYWMINCTHVLKMCIDGIDNTTNEGSTTEEGA